MTKPNKMMFELWTRIGPRNRDRLGPDPHEKGKFWGKGRPGTFCRELRRNG